jgi:glutaconate CoA-transferase subunit B
MDVSVAEIMVARMAAELSGEVIVSAVTPLGLLAGVLAKRTHAPDLALLATPESGLDAEPIPTLTLGGFVADRQRAVALDMEDVFDAIFTDRFRIWISPAQLDRQGHANISCIGPWEAPRAALVGARGIPEDSVSLSRLLFYLPNHSPRTLVAEVDFRSGAGAAFPLPGGRRRTTRLVTDLGVFGWDADGAFRVESLHPGVDAETVKARTGFPVEVPVDVPTTPLPTAAELAVIRESDPLGLRDVEFLGAGAVERWLQAFAAEPGLMAATFPYRGRRAP